MRTLFGFWCLMLAALAPAAQAQGQVQGAYPNKAITLGVPVPPGGAMASDKVAKSAPDGYTLLLNSITTHGIGPHIYPSLPYDAVKDFTPIVFVANLPLIMTINTGHEMKSVADVIAHAKTNPGKLTFASSGNGGAPHLAGELFQTIAGIKMLPVPYRGSGPAVIDVGAGRVDIMFDAVPSLLPLIQAGKLRPLAAASAARNPIVPDAPTFDELGIRGMEISLWYGLAGPAGLPQPIVQRLNAELGAILKTPEIREGFARQGAVATGGTPHAYTT